MTGTVAWQAARLPARHGEWGEAIVAELAAVPDGPRRLRWALGSLWFLVSRGRPALAPVPAPSGGIWSRRAFVLLGILTLAPWVAFSIQGLLERDAPDAPLHTFVRMLVAQVLIVVAFLANWRRGRGRPARIALIAAVAAYGADAAVSSVQNVGSLGSALLAGALFTGPTLLAVVPTLALGGSGHEPSPVPDSTKPVADSTT